MFNRYTLPVTKPPIVVLTDSSEPASIAPLPISLIEIQVKSPVGGKGSVFTQVASPPALPCPPALNLLEMSGVPPLSTQPVGVQLPQVEAAVPVPAMV